ncbi:MAG: FUSC family protein, partial [Pseudomonadaceae bacterium]
WARLSRPFGTFWAARRLERHGWLSLAELAVTRRKRDYATVASSFVDRTAQLLPRLTQLGDDGQALNDATRELRVCFRLLELRELHLTRSKKQQVQTVLQQVREHFLACAHAHRQLPPAQELLEALETALRLLQDDPTRIARRAAQALHGLRLALFPHAPASVPMQPPPSAADLAGAFA